MTLTTTTEAPATTRRQVELIVDWFDDRPPTCRTVIDLAQLMPAVERIVGHPVELKTLAEVYEAKVTRDLYDGSEADVDAQQARLDAAIDRLLGVEACAADGCRDVVPDGVLIECPHSGDGGYCSIECAVSDHEDRHGGACYALDLS